MILLFACANADVPREIAWDREVCDECGMTLSDPAFAVQLSTKDGRSTQFDDPGCAFKYILEEHPSIAHLWFHTSDGWLDWDAVEFVRSDLAPMDGGFQAVPLGSGGTSFADTSTAILTREAR
jgi:copper chaperone NosL